MVCKNVDLYIVYNIVSQPADFSANMLFDLLTYNKRQPAACLDYRSSELNSHVRVRCTCIVLRFWGD